MLFRSKELPPGAEKVGELESLENAIAGADVLKEAFRPLGEQ